MYLYICEGYKERGSTEELIRIALDMFLEETGTAGHDTEIARTEKGKPYFTNLPVQFSVSHTGNVWACLMTAGTDPVGLDIQQVREYNFGRIAAKYYTESEQQHISDKGAEGFFGIWTRKEAFAKYTGQGIGRYLAEKDTMNSREPVFKNLDIADGIECACCGNKEGNIWIRKI